LSGFNFMKKNFQNISRRNFLTVSGATAAALVSQSTPNIFAAATDNGTLGSSTANAPKKYPIGLELYSVRSELAKDLPNTLRTVAKMGYEAVEFYAPYYGWSF